MDIGNSKRILMLLENESFPEDCRVWLQSQALVAAGYRLSIICPTSRKFRAKRERIGQVEVYRYPKPLELPGFVGYALEFAYSFLMQLLLSVWVLLNSGFDAIHMHTPPDFNAVIPALFRWFGKRFIYDLHDLSPELYQAQRDGQGNRLIHRLLFWFERYACQRADLLLATNETQRNVQVRRCGANPAKCFVVRNGPSEAFLGSVAPLEKLRHPGCTTIGYVGVIGVQDGVDYLVRAVDCLVKQFDRSDIRAVIVGNGPAKGQLEQLVEQLQLQNYFSFMGYVPFEQVPAHIASFDICCTPDPSNAYNDSCTTIKTMEYMAMSKPVVCFETSENVKTAGAAALYASNNDVVQFARQILKLSDDVALRRRVGQEGRKRIEAGLTWEHQAAIMVAAYNHLFDSSEPNAEELDRVDGGNSLTSLATVEATDSGRVAR